MLLGVVMLIGFLATFISCYIAKRLNRLSEPLGFYFFGFAYTAATVADWLNGEPFRYLGVIIWWIGLPLLYYLGRWVHKPVDRQ